jgi:hypothetical protein
MNGPAAIDPLPLFSYAEKVGFSRAPSRERKVPSVRLRQFGIACASAVVIAMLTLLESCLRVRSSFQCTSSRACVNGAVIGRCESTGYCSFPDGGCADGWRYGSGAGSVSGQCVVTVALVAGSLSPSSAIVGAGPTKVTITGSGFLPSSQVTFDDAASTTTFVDATHLTATLSAEQLAAVGSIQVRVVNPPPDGRTSGPLSFAVSCVPIVSGLLAHWTMDAASIVGNQLIDSSGNQNDGTLYRFSPPITVLGRFGEALSYGASQGAHVDITTIALDLAAGHTNSFSFWFYRNAGAVDDAILLLPSPYGSRYDLWLTGSAGQFLCFNTGNKECLGIEDNNLIGRWVHVVALFGNGPTASSTLYVDGVLRAPRCLVDYGFAPCDVSGTAGLPVILGGDIDYYFYGELDDVRVFNRALTASEVTALYSGNACQ